MNSISKADTFVFSHYESDFSTGDLYFHYEVIANEHTTHFKEHWHLDTSTHIQDVPSELIDRALQSLHLIIGCSYYKAFCPKKIEIKNYSLSPEQAKIWDTIYTKGLGEFFYKNEIDFRGLIQFPFVEEEKEIKHETFALDEKALVMHGGGKDSIVTAELIKNSSIPFDLFCLNPKNIQENVAEVMAKQIISITRRIDPKLIELNKSSDIYNGHVPISTFYTFAAVLEAVLGKYRYIVISSERSSSYGHVEYLGEEINHQWSKSKEAEELLRKYIQTYIFKDLKYFSMLRPWYEIKVAERFASYPFYFEVFSSSNHNFKIGDKAPTQRWDYSSPKTIFVFTMLSAFLSNEEMLRIFGENLYEKSEYSAVFQELLGFSETKPFECVGTPEEMIVAMNMAYEKRIYSSEPIMKMFEEKVLSKNMNLDVLKEHVFSIGDASGIPDAFRNLL